MHSIPNTLKNASTRRPTIERLAPAKVNLALAVGAPRPGDGYHPICSWMAPVSMHDQVHVTRLEDDRLSRYALMWHEDAPVKSPINWPITKDLAVRAHHLLERETGRTLPLQLRLTKRIPVGGGLGGGSSDAAAMLTAVNELFSLSIPAQRMAQLALELGSDVAFFLHGGPAVVEGVGERVTPVGRTEAELVLVFPDFGCPTGQVYRAFDEIGPAPLRDADVHALAVRGAVTAGALFNDLAEPAIRTAPRLSEVQSRAAEITRTPVHITGSGSTLFAVAESGQAETLAAQLNDQLEGCVCRAVRLL